MLPLFEAAVYVCEYSWFWDWSRNMCNEWGYGTLYHWDDYLILHSKRVETKNIKIKEVHVFRKIITMTKFIMLLVMYTPTKITKQKPNKSSHVDFMLIYRWQGQGDNLGWHEDLWSDPSVCDTRGHAVSQHLACITLVGSSLVLEGRTRMEGRPFTSVLDVEVELQRTQIYTYMILPSKHFSRIPFFFYFFGYSTRKPKRSPVLGEWVGK